MHTLRNSLIFAVFIASSSGRTMNPDPLGRLHAYQGEICDLNSSEMASCADGLKCVHERDTRDGKCVPLQKCFYDTDCQTDDICNQGICSSTNEKGVCWRHGFEHRGGYCYDPRS